MALNRILLMFKTWGLPPCVEEHRFDTERKWRFDYAWLDEKVAIEMQGGIWRRSGGAHTGTGHLRDMEKFNEAQIQGWIVLQFTPDDLGTGAAIPTVKRALAARAGSGTPPLGWPAPSR